MKLTDVEVNDRPEIDGSIRVGGHFGARRVVYQIPRVPLDDYFPKWPHLSDAQRHTLVTSNLNAIKGIMQRQCELQAWREIRAPGGSFWLLEFEPRDLHRQLSDYQLFVPYVQMIKDGTFQVNVPIAGSPFPHVLPDVFRTEEEAETWLDSPIGRELVQKVRMTKTERGH